MEGSEMNGNDPKKLAFTQKVEAVYDNEFPPDQEMVTAALKQLKADLVDREGRQEDEDGTEESR